MAIKHKGNKAASGWRVPTAADIEEREIAIDLAEPAFYTKDESGGIIKISERGGIAWDNRQDYKIGDIVVDSGRVPQMAFLALQNNAGAALPTSGINADWQELDTIFYNVSTFNPTGDNYPNTTGEHLGATWYVNLGVDANGDSKTHLYTSGPLAGIIVADKDRLTWVDGVNPNEVWFHTPYPRINGERAGMIWRDGETYDIGDIVSWEGVDYVATVVPTYPIIVGSNPSTIPSEWKKLHGNEIHDPAKTYDPGDIVQGADGKDYTIPPGGNDTAAPPGNGWVLVTSDPERGGVSWNSSYNYVIGDIIMYPKEMGGTGNDKVYKALKNNIGVDPSADSSTWKAVGGLSPFDDTVDYDEGDVVVVDDDIYIAPIGNIPPGVPATNPFDPSMWIKSTRGGQLWKIGVNYREGDVATLDDVAYVAIGDNIGQSPDTSATIWQLTGGSTTYNPGTVYKEGDIVTVGDQIYIAPSGGVGPATLPPAAPWIKEGTTSYVDVTGDTMTGNLKMGGNLIENISCSNTEVNAINRNCWATNSLGGTLKARLSGTDLFLTNNGSNA